MIKIGCCGWSYYLPPKGWKQKYKSKLQAYASVFDLVEVNSTFYQIPKVSTAKKWKEEVREVSKSFEFTVKCSQIVSHKDRFKTKASMTAFDLTKNICKVLDTKVLLIQIPAGFKDTDENTERMNKFFDKINRESLLIAIEPRGFSDEVTKEMCVRHDLIHCVDPLRSSPVHLGSQKIVYFRLHGFGKPSMYNYSFSLKELRQVREKVRKLKAREYLILFNNVDCYQNASQFEKLN